MENILNIYEQPYDPEHPVVCFDERPCQLIENILAPIAMKPGKVQKENYEYERKGTCCVLYAFEPLTGRRLLHVRQRRTKKEYAEFMKELVSMYPKAKKIILVQDNLNTHNPSSFYENFSAEQAFKLADRFDMQYTPKKASWLNMVEIELSALSKQCLDRRIGDMKILEREASTWVHKREKSGVTVKWSFTKNRARVKLERHYELCID